MVSTFLGYLVEGKTKYKDFACFCENTNSEICKENISYKTCSFYTSLHYSYETEKLKIINKKTQEIKVVKYTSFLNPDSIL
jgi:hypothetical protein